MSTTDQISWAESHVGESYPDKHTPFMDWQTDGVWVYGEFCDAGAQNAASQGGFTWPEEVGCQWGTRGDSYVPYTIVHAQACGAWHDASEAPQIGWQPCFDWNDNGVADHIGACVTDVISDNSWVGIEFNAGGGSIRYVWRDKTYLMGWVNPTALVNSNPIVPEPPVPQPPLPGNPPLDFATFQPPLNWYITTPYMHGVTIEVTQAFLNSLDPDYPQLVQDGVYGPATRNRIVQFQQASGLRVDGVVGPVTATALHDLAVARGWTPGA